MRSHKKRLERLERIFGIRRGLTVIFTQPGETVEEAKQRVYAENPGAKNAKLELIFEYSNSPASPPALEGTAKDGHALPGRSPCSLKQGREGGASGGQGEPPARSAPTRFNPNLPYQTGEDCYIQCGRCFYKDTLEEWCLGPPRVPTELIRGMAYKYTLWQGREYLIQDGWLFDPNSGRRIDPTPCPAKPGAIMITH
jgi:hypothetical protein